MKRTGRREGVDEGVDVENGEWERERECDGEWEGEGVEWRRGRGDRARGVEGGGGGAGGGGEEAVE